MRYLCLWLGLLLSLYNGCTPSTSAPATPLPVVATPEVVAARLRPVAELHEAAEQLADALDVPAEQVRVRIQTQGCITCNVEQNAAASSLQGLAVDEAVAQIEPGAMLWLFVQTFTCTYRFDGVQFTPTQCQIAPL